MVSAGAAADVERPARNSLRRKHRRASVLKQLHPGRSLHESRSAASAVIGMLMSVAGWPHDALRTPDLPELLAELALRSLDLTPVPLRKAVG